MPSILWWCDQSVGATTSVTPAVPPAVGESDVNNGSRGLQLHCVPQLALPLLRRQPSQHSPVVAPLSLLLLTSALQLSGATVGSGTCVPACSGGSTCMVDDMGNHYCSVTTCGAGSQLVSGSCVLCTGGYHERLLSMWGRRGGSVCVCFGSKVVTCLVLSPSAVAKTLSCFLDWFDSLLCPCRLATAPIITRNMFSIYCGSGHGGHERLHDMRRCVVFAWSRFGFFTKQTTRRQLVPVTAMPFSPPPCFFRNCSWLLQRCWRGAVRLLPCRDGQRRRQRVVRSMRQRDLHHWRLLDVVLDVPDRWGPAARRAMHWS